MSYVVKIPAEPEMRSGSSWQKTEVTHLMSSLTTDVTKLEIGMKVEILQTNLETVRKMELLSDARFLR